MSEKKSVSFSSLIIREYALCIGEPCPEYYIPMDESGPFLQLDWNHVNERKVDIESYEATRRRLRRGNNCLRLNSSQRRILLQKQGFSQTDFTKAQQHFQAQLKCERNEILPDPEDERRRRRKLRTASYIVQF